MCVPIVASMRRTRRFAHKRARDRSPSAHTVGTAPEGSYRAFRDAWLRLAKNVGQAGRPVVLCGSAVPQQYEACPERRYFAIIHYLALVCDEDRLCERLEARPGWRQSGSTAFLERMVAFNRWFVERGPGSEPRITLLDTSALSVHETARWVAGWIQSRLLTG
jgi:hypothetical protein